MKIADFGLSKLLRDNSSFISCAGTRGFALFDTSHSVALSPSSVCVFRYLAPELFGHTEDMQPGLAVDVFSFGVVLGEMLAMKRPPYRKSDMLEYDWPPRLVALYEDCTRFKPSERPSMSEVCIALESLLATLDLEQQWQLNEEILFPEIQEQRNPLCGVRGGGGVGDQFSRTTLVLRFVFLQPHIASFSLL